MGRSYPILRSASGYVSIEHQQSMHQDHSDGGKTCISWVAPSHASQDRHLLLSCRLYFRRGAESACSAPRKSVYMPPGTRCFRRPSSESSSCVEATLTVSRRPRC